MIRWRSPMSRRLSRAALALALSVAGCAGGPPRREPIGPVVPAQFVAPAAEAAPPPPAAGAAGPFVGVPAIPLETVPNPGGTVVLPSGPASVAGPPPPGGPIEGPPAAPPPGPLNPPVAVAGPPVVVDADKIGCATCGGLGRVPSHSGGALTKACATCGGGGCVPGRAACYPIEAKTFLGRFCCRLYECLCCPDPCYEPRWVPEANAAFFVDFARPRTIQRFRWDYYERMQFPDRSEFFWARQQLDSPAPKGGRGPKLPHQFPKNPKTGQRVRRFRGEQSVNLNELTMYNEAASGRASAFIELPYVSTDPVLTAHAAGFGDLRVGTKALLLDCELLQITFQFRTITPTGNAGKGLGTGHVSLEPSLLMALKISESAYLQGQLAEWIPLGGDPDYAGAVLHYHFSYNHSLCRLSPNTGLIGTLEFNGWSFQDGAYTDPILGPFRRSSGESYFSAGPGLRMTVCDRFDFGMAMAWPLSDHHWADPMLRAEFRILY